MLKTSAQLCLAALLVCGLSACGSTEVKPAVDTAETPSPAPILAPPAEAAPSQAQSVTETSASNGPTITLVKEASDLQLSKVIQTQPTAVSYIVSIESGAFSPGSSYIGVEYTEKLQEAGRILKNFPEIKLLIEGHTDDTGAEGRNSKLSLKRAGKVKAILVGAGVDPDRLTAVGYGPRKPASTDKSDEGRALNRRVEIKFAN